VKKIKINEITEGAIYIALYGILALLTRYIFVSFDSIIYYFFPLPMAIYSIRKDYKLGLLVLFGSVLISFLFGNVLYVIGLILPNIFVGYIFGLMEKKSSLKIINYIICFILLLLSDFLSIYLFTNGTYFDEALIILNKISSSISSLSEEMINQILTICSTIVLIIDSIVKEILLIILFNILIIRLKLKDDFESKMNLKIIYNPIISIVYIILTILCIYLTGLLITANATLINILFTIIFTIWFIMGFYIFYQYCFMLRLELNHSKVYIFLILFIISIVLFPIGILIGLILNVISYNYVLRSLK